MTRTRDNRTVVAFWDPIETTLPFQPVEFYEFQYRDAGKGGGETTSSVPGSFNYAVIQNVVNANDYEVCVYVCVCMSACKIKYFTFFCPVSSEGSV